MKRYKVVDFETKGDELKESTIDLLLDLTDGRVEICLEEIETEEESGTMKFGIKDFCENPCCKDQSLTPKDVGMRKGQAYENFVSWWGRAENRMKAGNYSELFYLKDEEFDRLYQEFLKSYKK